MLRRRSHTMRGLRAGLLWAASAAIACNGGGERGTREPADAPKDAAFAFPVEDLAMKAGPPDLAQAPDEESWAPFGEPCGEVMGSILLPGLQYSGSVSLVRNKAGNQNQKERVSVSAPILPNVLVLY